MKKTINFLLDHEYTEKFFVFLILLELVVCQFDTGSNSYTLFKTLFNYFEIFIIAVFTIEYVLRIFTTDKIKNVFKPLMMVDLLTILPVTGLIFLLVLLFSSAFSFLAEQSTAHFALKKMPPSSLWSIVAFVIYCWQDHDLSFSVASRFITSITPSLNIFAQGIAVCVVGVMIYNFVMQKYNAFNLKKMTIREEIY